MLSYIFIALIVLLFINIIFKIIKISLKITLFVSGIIFAAFAFIMLVGMLI